MTKWRNEERKCMSWAKSSSMYFRSLNVIFPNRVSRMFPGTAIWKKVDS